MAQSLGLSVRSQSTCDIGSMLSDMFTLSPAFLTNSLFRRYIVALRSANRPDNGVAATPGKFHQAVRRMADSRLQMTIENSENF